MRTERESDRRRKEEKCKLVGAAENSKELAEWHSLQRKNLNTLGMLKRKEWPQCHRESSWQVRQSRPFRKEKEQSRLSRAPDRKGGESQGERVSHLGERGKSEREHGEERVDSTVKEGRFQGGEGGQARRASLKEVEGSMSG